MIMCLTSRCRGIDQHSTVPCRLSPDRPYPTTHVLIYGLADGNHILIRNKKCTSARIETSFFRPHRCRLDQPDRHGTVAYVQHILLYQWLHCAPFWCKLISSWSHTRVHPGFLRIDYLVSAGHWHNKILAITCVAVLPVLLLWRVLDVAGISWVQFFFGISRVMLRSFDKKQNVW